MSSTSLTWTLCFYSEPANMSGPEYIAETQTLPGTRNYEHNRVKVPIWDIRGEEHKFNLDEHSFLALPQAFSPGAEFEGDEGMARSYLPWVRDLVLKTVAGSTGVFIFDHTVRRASAAKSPRRQVRKMHVDQSPGGALGRARRHLPASERAAVESGCVRFRIVNVWRPLGPGEVADHPLVFADCRTVAQEDLVPVRQVYPDYVGETYAVRHGPGQRYHYWSRMGPRDVLLLQCFDSSRSGGGDRGAGGQCANGSFELHEPLEEPCLRESIEPSFAPTRATRSRLRPF
ncbi:hypothetical protein GGTG_06921 [Gaeumannomyces tritici R3-111a-1]|uniref:Methyltransferase n=1 Tax=Gaeumannomyces tritici (strain R3-111a-1) TaxID=644352 RepID=J3P074_GAET3|nr:hypothetical protein GGTG_06921 [Gaeumannomyces tritici R3-111a-1]EJT77007.1 hypothetical protein GGTG_06921 [Gaeumannomyces tritici R3-111a-1]